MPTVTLTELTLRNLKAVPGKQVTYLDKTGPAGFGVRVGDKARVYVLTYGEDRKRVKLGDVGLIKLADARQKAKDILAEHQLRKGKAALPSVPLTDALDRFYEAHKAKNRPKSHYETKRLLERHLRPKFKKRNLDQISSPDLAELIDKLSKTPAEARALYTAAKTYFRWCLARGYVNPSPMEPLAAPSKARSRDRVLTQEELKAIYEVARAGTTPFHRIVTLCILTGQRRGAIAGLQWDWISDDRITFPAAAVKQGKPHVLPIGKQAQATIAAVTRLAKNPYLFPAAKGKAASIFNGWSKAKIAFDKELAEKGYKVAPYTLHDLRRTFATGLQQLGVRLEVTEAILGHVSGSRAGVVGIYQRHTWFEESREAITLWENHLAALLKN